MSHALPSAQISMLSIQGPMPLVARLLVKAAVVVTKWDIQRRTRVELKHLDPWLLEDIGLSQFDAQREAAKPFWRG